MPMHKLPAYSVPKKAEAGRCHPASARHEIDENQSRMVSSSCLCQPTPNHETDLELFLTPSVELIQPFLSSPLGRRLFGKTGVGPTTTPTRPSEARFLLRSRDPVERLVRDGVLSEKEA